MEALNGKFRMISSDNKAAVMKAWFHNALNDKDMEIMMNPANIITTEMIINDKGVKVTPTYSLKPELSESYEYTLGEEKVLGAPYNCKSNLTISGNVIKEVVSYENDDTMFTYISTVSSQGMTLKCLGSDGYIGTAYFERVAACITGFYMMESHENMEKVIAEDSGCSDAEAAEIMSSIACRVTESNGTYTLTDYLGNGSSKSVVFKLDQEFEVDDATLGLKGIQIVTKTGPGAYKFTHKDHSGKISIWECVVTEDLLTFKLTKPLNTQTGSIIYRKYPDILGTFKTVSISGAEDYFSAMGMPDYAKEFALDRPTSTLSYLGKGMFQWTTDSKLLDFGPLVWKAGEEFTYTWNGKICTEVITLTKKGLAGVTKGEDITSPFTSIMGKTFMIVEETLAGNPIAKMTYIYTRL